MNTVDMGANPASQPDILAPGRRDLAIAVAPLGLTSLRRQHTTRVQRWFYELTPAQN